MGTQLEVCPNHGAQRRFADGREGGDYSLFRLEGKMVV